MTTERTKWEAETARRAGPASVTARPAASAGFCIERPPSKVVTIKAISVVRPDGLQYRANRRSVVKRMTPAIAIANKTSQPTIKLMAPASEATVDPQRNNNFNYAKMDPHGYAAPLGSHIRRMNSRDTTVGNLQRRKIIRRGATYGPALPEGAPEDGVDRGIAAFVICASLIRQFEFVQNVWTNDPNFHELGNERDPMIGAQDDTFDFTIPKRTNPTKDKGLARFHDREGGCLLLPSRYQDPSIPHHSGQLIQQVKANTGDFSGSGGPAH